MTALSEPAGETDSPAPGNGSAALNASACERSQSPALSMKRFARSASTP